MVKVLQDVDLALGRNRFFKPESFLGKVLGVGGTDAVRDTAEFLLKQPAKGKATSGIFQKALNLLPSKAQVGLGHLLNKFNHLPGMSKIPCFTRVNLLFQMIPESIGVVRDSIAGFRNSEGGLFSKVISGIKSGIKSMVKSTGALAAAMAGALIVPAMFGLTGPLGIILGAVSSAFTSSFAHKRLGKILHLPNRADSKSKEEPAPVQSGAEIARQIEKSWENRDFNSYLKDSNPWLLGDGMLKQGKLS